MSDDSKIIHLVPDVVGDEFARHQEGMVEVLKAHVKDGAFEQLVILALRHDLDAPIYIDASHNAARTLMTIEQAKLQILKR